VSIKRLRGEKHMKKGFVSFVVIITLCCSFASCSKKSESTLQTGAGRISKPDVEIEPQSIGEPVPGAEIYVELEPDDEPILNVTADGDGYFEFTELPPPAPPFPNEGTFVFNILPSKEFIEKNKLDPKDKFVVSVPYSKKDIKPSEGKSKRILFQYLLESE
jgi:hypothetical protein